MQSIPERKTKITPTNGLQAKVLTETWQTPQYKISTHERSDNTKGQKHHIMKALQQDIMACSVKNQTAWLYKSR